MPEKESLETLVNAGPVRKKADRVMLYFERDNHFYDYLRWRLGSNGIEISREQLKANLKKKGNRGRIAKGIKDIVLELDEQLSSNQSFDAPVEHLLPISRKEGPRIRSEILDCRKQIMDWYQLKGMPSLAGHLSENLRISYHQALSIIEGREISLNNRIIRVHEYLKRMVESAEAGKPLEVKSELLRENKESLSEMLSGIAEQFFGSKDHKAVEYVKERLADFKTIKQYERLAKSIAESYGFMHKTIVYHLVSVLAELPYFKVKSHVRTQKKPANFHRKLYAAALFFDYAKDKEEREKIAETYKDFVQVRKAEYFPVIRRMQRKKFPNSVLAALIGRYTGTTPDAARIYLISGKVPYIAITRLDALETLDALMDSINVVDLRDDKTKEREYRRFMESSDERPLLAVAGRKNEAKVLGEMRAHLPSRIKAYRYPAIDMGPGFSHWNELPNDEMIARTYSA